MTEEAMRFVRIFAVVATTATMCCVSGALGQGPVGVDPPIRYDPPITYEPPMRYGPPIAYTAPLPYQAPVQVLPPKPQAEPTHLNCTCEDNDVASLQSRLCPYQDNGLRKRSKCDRE